MADKTSKATVLILVGVVGAVKTSGAEMITYHRVSRKWSMCHTLLFSTLCIYRYTKSLVDELFLRQCKLTGEERAKPRDEHKGARERGCDVGPSRQLKLPVAGQALT